jgi:hypothetical protein
MRTVILETTMPVLSSRSAPAAASALRRWEAPVLTMLPLVATGIGAAASRPEPAAPAAAANGAMVKLNVAGDMQFQGNQDFF